MPKKADTPRANAPQAQLLNKKMHDVYAVILGGHQKTINTQREDRIVSINDFQNQQLELGGMTVIPNNAEHEYHRKLVAYYRPTQITYVSAMQIVEIMRFLRYYVEEGYSSIFDEFAVLYRFPEYDKLEEFEQNSYGIDGIDFKAISSIYANTIHFSNGTPDFLPGTMPILGTTPHNRWRQQSQGRHIHLPLEYTTIEKIGHKRGILSHGERKAVEQQRNIHKLIPVLNIVLNTLQKTEQAMMDNVSCQ